MVLLSPWLGPTLDLGDRGDSFIFWQLRLPRVLLASAAGAGLALAGVAFQALLRNPLATPYTLGVSSGSALAIVLFLVAGLDAKFGGSLGRPLVGMAGALLVIGITYRAARVRGHLPAPTLLLAGVTLTYVFSALIVAVQYTATPEDAALILRWLVGSVESGLGFLPPAAVGVVLAVALTGLLPLGRAYNALSGGEEAAQGVGVDAARVARRSYLFASLLVGAIVAFTGPIGFVGLIVPHCLRLLGAVDNRTLLPAAAFAGAGFLALCDGLTRLLFAGRLPVGVITQLLGGPFFLVLLLREKRRLY
ncbi:MAG: FecCD family ABC transporter permease [Planctomycetaceae bacterium]